MKPCRIAGIVCGILMALSGIATAQDGVIELPEPKIRGQVMETLRDRISVKGFSSEELADRDLGELLWAGFGIANGSSGRRTAPSAFGANEIDIYVIRADGAYRYVPEQHALVITGHGDHRGLVATQGYAKNAPVHLIFVADYDRARSKYPANYDSQMKNWALMHTGFIVQNIVLYCSSHGMSAVVRSPGMTGRLREALNIRGDKEIIMSQAVGYEPDDWR